MNAALHSERRFTVAQKRRHGKAALRRGTDAYGRFIGHNDVERGAAFFWDQPHRRASAPLVRGLPEFGAYARRPGSGAPGVPRASKSGLTPPQLREMHAMRHATPPATYQEIADRFEVPWSTVHYHVTGSVAMRAALRSAPEVEAA